MRNQTVIWPAIIHFNGDPELTFIASQADWAGEADLYVGQFAFEAQLIDAQGTIFKLQPNDKRATSLIASGQVATLAEVIALVKAHLSQQGACCVSKLFAASIGEAINIAFPDPE